MTKTTDEKQFRISTEKIVAWVALVTLIGGMLLGGAEFVQAVTVMRDDMNSMKSRQDKLERRLEDFQRMEQMMHELRVNMRHMMKSQGLEYQQSVQ